MEKKVKRILIVEDEKTLALTLYEVLFTASGDFEVVVCDKAEDALKKLEEKEFDLLITDLKLPGSIDGLDLIRRINKMSLKIPKILMTAYGTEEVREEARKLGVKEYFEKPFSLLEFVSKVKEILGVK
ncbi:MAG: response regulator [candidate division WOR-3 bacterium]